VRSPQAADGAVRSVNAADLISPCGARPATPARPDKSARPACRPHTLSRRTVGGSSLRNHRTCRPCAARCSDALRSAPPRGGERPWARGSHRRCARRIPRAGHPGLATAMPLFFAPPRDPAVTRWCLSNSVYFRWARTRAHVRRSHPSPTTPACSHPEQPSSELPPVLRSLRRLV
jgi:hypothetical protein